MQYNYSTKSVVIAESTENTMQIRTPGLEASERRWEWQWGRFIGYQSAWVKDGVWLEKRNRHEDLGEADIESSRLLSFGGPTEYPTA